MVDDLVIRPANEMDKDQILGLLKLSLGEGSIPRDPGYWSWKHEINPFGPSPVLIAEAGERIVGLRVFMRWSWKSGPREIRAVRAVDTATHPDWRGRGIFSRLTLALVERMKAEGVSFVFNTPNQLSRPGYLKMGWSSVGRVSLLIRPCRPIRLVQAAMKQSGGRPNIARDALVENSGFRSVAELLMHPEFCKLHAELPREGNRLTTPWFPGYLRWRYADVPGFAYHAAWSWKDRAGAAMIFRIRQKGELREFRICDILLGPDRPSARLATGLIRGAIQEVRPDYAAAMAASHTPERRALYAAGFLPAPRMGPILTVRPLASSPSGWDPLDRSSWRLSIGDLELF